MKKTGCPLDQPISAESGSGGVGVFRIRLGLPLDSQRKRPNESGNRSMRFSQKNEVGLKSATETGRNRVNL